MTGPYGSVDEPTTADSLAVEGVDADAADLVEQRTDPVAEPPDPERVIPVRPPDLDHASEVDAADSMVEVSLDEEDWGG